MDQAIKKNISAGDFVRLKNRTSASPVVGEVISDAVNAIQLRIYSPMTSEILRKFSLPPIAASSFPIAARTSIIELVATSTIEESTREDVADIVFILPSTELESGLVFLTGAANLYFVRYFVNERSALKVNTSIFFGCHMLIQPLSIRLFTALNNLAYNIKKLMYHRPQAEDTRRSFRIFFPSEAFHYLYHKLNNPSILKFTTMKNQRIIKYYDDIKSESSTKAVTTTWLRILTVSGMISLRNILGVGIGFGSTQSRPSKTRPIQYCTINSTLTSVECDLEIPMDFRKKPHRPWYKDGIDLLYSMENNSLACHVRFSRLRVTSPEVATTRIPAANVVAENDGAYVGAWFHYEATTFAVIEIANDICYCECVETEGVLRQFPTDLVNELVSNFGS